MTIMIKKVQVGNSLYFIAQTLRGISPIMDRGILTVVM